jgi:hypothetical protein
VATKKTDTIAGKTIQLGLDHSVTIEAVRGRKVTIIAQPFRHDDDVLRGQALPQRRHRAANGWTAIAAQSAWTGADRRTTVLRCATG